AGLDGLVADHHALGRHPLHVDDGWLEPQAFVDRLRNETTVLANHLELLRVAQQRSDHAAESVIARIAGGVHELPEKTNYDIVGQAFSVNLRVSDHVHEIPVADRVLTSRGDHGFEVGGELTDRLVGMRHVVTYGCLAERELVEYASRMLREL